MNTKPGNSRGFTIIEVMLFLAITGLMMLGILAAIAGGINRQQYDDTISSLVDEFQGQYNLIDNVRSNRSDSLICNNSGIGDIGNTNSPRGTSACTVIGRLVRSDDGQIFTSEPVYARQDITEPAPENLSGEAGYVNWLQLTTANHSLIEAEVETYRLPWSGNVYINGDTNRREFSLLLLKLPSNGMVRTYSLQRSTTDLTEIMTPTSDSDRPLRVCVQRTGFALGGPSVGARIDMTASNVSGVQRIASSDTGDQAC